MRQRAVRLFEVAVKAADPATALRPHLTDLPTISGRYILISIGKAACAMMEEAIVNLPKDARFEAIAVTNYENARILTVALSWRQAIPCRTKTGKPPG